MKKLKIITIVFLVQLVFLAVFKFAYLRILEPNGTLALNMFFDVFIVAILVTAVLRLTNSFPGEDRS